jgi:hypothetical protein
MLKTLSAPIVAPFTTTTATGVATRCGTVIVGALSRSPATRPTSSHSRPRNDDFGVCSGARAGAAVIIGVAMPAHAQGYTFCAPLPPDLLADLKRNGEWVVMTAEMASGRRVFLDARRYRLLVDRRLAK